MRLPNKSVGVAGGWRFFEPSTKVLITGPDWRTLIRLVMDHRGANGVMTGSWATTEVEVEKWLCEQLGDYCEDSLPNQSGSFSMGTSFTTLLRGTGLLAAWFLAHRPKVDQATADKHASICVGCPYNQEPQGCSPCSWDRIRQLVTSIVGADKTAYDAGLKSCSLCGCALAAKTWFAPEFLRGHMSAAQLEALPPHCWILPKAT